MTDRSFHKWNSCQSWRIFISTWSPSPCPVTLRSDQPSTLACEPLSGSDRPPLWGRNNKIIPTLTIILPTSASSAAPSAFLFSHPSNLICVHASISDLLLAWPSPPTPTRPGKRKKPPSGGCRSALHVGSMSPNARREHIRNLCPACPTSKQDSAQISQLPLLLLLRLYLGCDR